MSASRNSRWCVTPAWTSPPAASKACPRSGDEPFLQRRCRRQEVPRRRIDVFEHDRAAGAEEAEVGGHLLVAAAEGAELEPGVHEIERGRLEVAGEEVVLDERDVSEPLGGDEGVGGRQHLLVDVGAGDRSVRADPLAEQPQPPHGAAADVERAGATPVADLLEQPPAGGLPHA